MQYRFPFGLEPYMTTPLATSPEGLDPDCWLMNAARNRSYLQVQDHTRTRESFLSCSHATEHNLCWDGTLLDIWSDDTSVASHLNQNVTSYQTSSEVPSQPGREVSQNF